MSLIKARILISELFLLVLWLGLSVQTEAQTVRTAPRVAQQTRQLLQRIRVNSDNFRVSLETSLQNIRLRGAEAENINRDLDNYEATLNDYEDRLQSREDSASDVRQILAAAAKINSWLEQNRLGARVNRDWNLVKTSLNQLAREYNLNRIEDFDNPISDYPNNYPSNNDSSAQNDSVDNNSIYGARLTGTYQLDQSRSDDAAEVADRAASSLPLDQQESARATLEQRLETPDRIAINQRGNQFTLVSSRAPSYDFLADGKDKFETGDNNSSLRVRATLLGERLEVATSGTRGNDYNVIFEPLDDGRSLRVTRRLSTDFLRQAIVVTSIYERTSQIAQLDLYSNPNNTPVIRPRDDDDYFDPIRNDNKGYIVTSDAKLLATLNEGFSTKTSNNNDRFTMTVQTPTEYRGAIIEGYLSGINRSGKVTGRATLSFNFETIRLRSGKTYDFAGFVENIRNNNGSEIKVDNEGRAQGGSQTKQTATRSAVGAGLGALIGAIAGGGKGAAIGAIIGGGAGAGSVYAEGRDDLEVNAGSEFYIRATAPNRAPR